MVLSLRCLDSRGLLGRPCSLRSTKTPASVSSSRPLFAKARTVQLRSLGGGDQDVQSSGGVAQGPVVVQTTEEVAYTAPEATATYTAITDPQFRAYQQAQQQYYGTAPPPYPNYPMYMPPPAPASPGLPWWLLVGGGVLIGAMLGKLSELVKKGPQQVMAEMAMKQMMGSMGGAAGQMPPGFPGASPFGAGAGPSPFAPGASPFGGFPSPPQPPAGGYNSQASSATVDATATSVQGRGDAGRPGDRFQSRLGGNSSSNGTGSTTAGLPVVEPTVSEPTSSTSSSGRSNGASASTSSSSSPPRNAFFTDVNVEEPAKASPGAAGAAGAWGAGGAQQQPGAGTSAADPEGVDAMGTMLEQMLRSPNMQKMLYPYLPENMRNPTSIEWMLGNPEVKKQMATMFAQQNISPQMLNMMKNMDFNQDKVDKQFQELGMKPEDVMSKVMANPELAAGFSNPRVQSAIMDISANPMNITKYASDPEIMKVLNEVQQIFQPDVPPQYRQ